MILLPAVDIRDGRAVRLQQGDFARETVYEDDPLEAARSFADAGARFLHVVDLDGARSGRPANLDQLGRITRELDMPVQYGGGLRSAEAIRDALEAGASRVVLGTAAISDPDLLEAALGDWPEQVAVGVDARGGRVSLSGWTEEAELGPVELIQQLQERGAGTFIYTDVDRDGMLEGPDLERVRQVGEAVDGRFLYSGGIGSLEHLQGLRGLGLANLEGVISGKALYEGRFGVAEAQAVLGR